ncbi:hypothetical protein FRB90_005711 [Tulasnella sp. 427]|nr:hypothetical protein FRB90_005711 [Tulasnella sp. 427]
MPHRPLEAALRLLMPNRSYRPLTFRPVAPSNSYVYPPSASSYVKYTPLGPHFATAPPKVTPTNNAIVNSPREASESKLFDSPSTTSSPSTSTASSREPSACDSSSDSSDASTSSSSSRQSSTASNISGSSASSSRASRLQPTDDTNDSNRYAIIEDVLRHENLYEVLGVTKTADLQALRRGYLTRSKRCHPE